MNRTRSFPLTAWLILGVSIAFQSPLLAQSRPADSLPDEIKRDVNDGLGSVLNGLHVFSSADMVSSGSFKFLSKDTPDDTLNVLKLSGDYRFEECQDQGLVPFVSGLLGSAKITSQIPPEEGPGQNDFTTTTTMSIGIGGGVDWNVVDKFHLIPKMMLVYSRSTNNFDYNNLESQTYFKPFDGDLFNWDVDTITYLPSIKGEYRWESQHHLHITPSVQYAYLNIDSTWTNSSILDVKTSSGVLQPRLAIGAPLNTTLLSMPLSNEVFTGMTRVSGDARNALGFSDYYEAGILFSVDSHERLPVLTRVGLGFSYAWNPDMNGWRIGLEGKV